MTVTTTQRNGLDRFLFAACAWLCKVVIGCAAIVATAGGLAAYAFNRPNLSVPVRNWGHITALDAAIGGGVLVAAASLALLVVRAAAATPPPPTSDAEAYDLRHSNWKD